MREIPSAWLRPPVLIALILSTVACSVSLRGVANPGSTFSTPSPVAAGGPPTVSIASPPTGITVKVGDTIDVDVRAADPWSVGVNRLELFAGDTLVDRVLGPGAASSNSFTGTLEWSPREPGTVVLSAYSYRADGSASAPATLTVVVTGQPLPASATPTIVALPTDTPTANPSGSFLPSPSSTEVPTVTLSPSPKPTPKPTPSPTPVPTPTPAPIGVHIDVWVDPADLPSWTVGVRSHLLIHVDNDGANPISYVRISASLAGSTTTLRTGPIAAGQKTTITVSLTPQAAGSQKLSVTGKLPAGYFDTDPQSNTLVWNTQVSVASGAPPPTATPTASPAGTP